MPEEAPCRPSVMPAVPHPANALSAGRAIFQEDFAGLGRVFAKLSERALARASSPSGMIGARTGPEQRSKQVQERLMLGMSLPSTEKCADVDLRHPTA